VYTGPYVRPGVTHIDDIWEHVLIGGFVLLHWWDMKSHHLLEKVVKKLENEIKSTMVHGGTIWTN
jgi:hypothetical protein